jgi:acetyl esterase/lipase
MKRILLLSLLTVPVVLAVYAQGTRYATKTDIPYYINATDKSDEYLNERCVLDIYYPENLKGFTTIVWFHGGGLTGGNKEIPYALRDQGNLYSRGQLSFVPEGKGTRVH